MVVLAIVLFCYISILKKIRHQVSTLSSISQSNRKNQNEKASDQYTEIERKATKKILSYIVVFMFQWVPMLISQIARFVKVRYSFHKFSRKIRKKSFLSHRFLFM